MTAAARKTNAVTMDESGVIAVMEQAIADAGVLVGFEAALIGDRDLAAVESGAANAPIVLGCSLVGRVLEADAESRAAGLEVGGRVVAASVQSCGTCEACAAGDEPRCEHALHRGQDIDGFWRDVNRIPASSLCPIAPTLDLATASHAGELALALRAADLAHVEGRRVAVFGSGPLAALAVATCVARGAVSAEGVEQIDRFSERGVAQPDARPDVIVNVSSAPRVVDQAIQAVAIGGTVATCAAPSEMTPRITDYTPNMQRRDVRLIGVSAPSRTNLRSSIELLEQGRIAPPLARSNPQFVSREYRGEMAALQDLVGRAQP